MRLRRSSAVGRKGCGSTRPAGGRDTLAALTQLGAAGRARSDAVVCAVTGSTGKTSTKELLRGACTALGKTHAAAASYNNHWGVPLTLARLPKDARWAICEVGMNRPGEIRALTRLVRPHLAVITNIGVAHLEYLGSREGIADAKAEIFEGFEPGGKAVLPRGDDFFDRLSAAAKAQGAEVISFGAHPSSDVRLLDYHPVGEGGDVVASFQGQALTFHVPFAGRHQAINALAALAAVQAMGGDVERAAAGLRALRPLAGRGAGVAFHLARVARSRSWTKATTATLTPWPPPFRCCRRWSLRGKDAGWWCWETCWSWAPTPSVFTLNWQMPYRKAELPVSSSADP